MKRTAIRQSCDESRTCRAAGRHSRAAFSLLELLIVLGILAGIAALVTPALRGPLAKSRVRGAARDIRAALNKARVLAIRGGSPVAFRYSLNGSDWKIERIGANPFDDGIPGNSDAESLNATPSGLAIDLETGERVDERAAKPSVLRTGILSEGLSFQNAKAGTNAEEANRLPEGLADPSDEFATLAANQQLQQWADPIRFEPMGRSEDRTLLIVDDRFEVAVTIRGLTGTVTYAGPRLRPRHSEEPLLSTGQESVR